MISGSSLRNSCIFLGCLALSIFAAQTLLGDSAGLPSLYRFKSPLGWQDEAEHQVSEQGSHTDQDAGTSISESLPGVALVVASQSTDDTSWLDDVFLDWQKNIYVTNDPNARLTVPKNKGREGMVYLTYIIDNYDRLPEVNLFRHAERYQWHSDDPLFDGRRLLSRLQLSYIRHKGYTNLRCGWILTCPASVHPHDDAWNDEKEADPDVEGPNASSFYKDAYEALFPGDSVPDEIGGPCCAQFAVTAKRIRQRPRSDYERFRAWLAETELDDDISGRIMEYSWHIIFREPAVSCPLAADCYCGLYGICNLECEGDGDCSEQYVMPEYSSMPDGWPDVGWDFEWRNATEMRMEYDEKYPVVTAEDRGQVDWAQNVRF